jgi:hypothetical protein
MIGSIAASTLYSSQPTEQRLKMQSELRQYAAKNPKNTPVYLQVELAKSAASSLRVSILA